MKKILALVLTLALCLTSFVFFASAEAVDSKPATFTPWIDFTDWTEEQLAAFAVNKEKEVIVPTVEDGLLTLTMTNTLGYVGYYAPGTSIAIADDETGEVTGAYPGCVLSLNEGHSFVESTSTTNGVALYVDLSNFDSSYTSLNFYFNDVDYDAEGNPVKKAGKPVSTSWKGTVTVPANYVGWVQIPFADFVCEWSTTDENGMIDLNTIDWFMIYPNNPTNGGVFKIGNIGFYGSEFVNVENYEAPAYYTPWIDFAEWGEDELAPFALSGDWGSAVPSVDKNGLLTVTSTNSSYTQYYAPGTDIVYKDDETGEVTGAYPGCVSSLWDGNGFVDSTSTDSGVCFFVDLSACPASQANADGTQNVLFYFNDYDFDAEGKPVKKAGKPVATSWKGTAVVPAGYIGWVTIPFADFVPEWGATDENGKMDLNTIDWFMIYPNVTAGDTTFKIGKVGFYGPAMYALDENVVLGRELPDGWSLIVDAAKIEADDTNGSNFGEFPTFGTIESGANGLLVTTPADGAGWWLQKNFAFNVIDDETGDRGDVLPGFTASLPNSYDSTSDEAGLAFYIESPETAADQVFTDKEWWVAFYLQEKEIDEDGNFVLKGGQQATTTFAATVYLPANFKGWVKVPFSALSQAKWGEQASDIANEDGIFDAACITNITYVSSVYAADVKGADGKAAGYSFTFGDVAVWGDPIQTETEDGGNTEPSNPDSGVVGTGIASALAIAALAVAAAACFRKKED